MNTINMRQRICFWPFDRELCSKVFKEPLLSLFLGLAGNHEQQMFQIEQKLCNRTKNVHKGFCGTLWYWKALYGLFLPYMASVGETWFCMAVLWSFSRVVIDPKSFGPVVNYYKPLVSWTWIILWCKISLERTLVAYSQIHIINDLPWEQHLCFCRSVIRF